MARKEAHSSAEEAQTLTRRSFLKLGLSSLAALALLEVGAGSFAYFRSRATEGEFGGLVSAGAIDDFPPGSVTEFREAHFFLVRAKDGGFLALYSRCTHLGCNVNWLPESEGFYCPCHASSFDIFGDFRRPPVPRALDTFAVSFVADQIIIDSAHVQRRNRFDRAQLSYADDRA